MDRNTFEMIGSTTFGGTRWGSKMAARTGLSTALISNIRTGKITVSDKTAAIVRSLLPASRVEAASSEQPVALGDGTEHSFAGTDLAGAATFRLRLVAQDLTSHRFVKVGDVNPALFFPAFAPAPQVVQYVAPRGMTAALPEVSDDDHLSDETILGRIDSRVAVMDQIANSVIYNGFPSMIVSGAPGVGKSHTIMKALEEAKLVNSDMHIDIIKGAVRAPGLYKALFAARNGGKVVLDDSDSVFEDEDALNLLKAALDSNKVRKISWRKESSWLKDCTDEEGEIVRDFIFEGGVIFITNVSMQNRIAAGHRMTPHYEALISRSFYIDLTMDSVRSRTLRVRSVFIDRGMAAGLGLSDEDAVEIMGFMSENAAKLTEMSLRMAMMVTMVFQTNRSNWKEIIRVTKMKG